MMLVGFPWVSLEQPVLLSCAHLMSFGALVLVEQQRAQVRPCSGSLFSPTAQGFSHLWVWFICLWQGKVWGQSSGKVKLFAQFIYLSSVSLVLYQPDKASLTESPLTEANSYEKPDKHGWTCASACFGFGKCELLVAAFASGFFHLFLGVPVPLAVSPSRGGAGPVLHP